MNIDLNLITNEDILNYIKIREMNFTKSEQLAKDINIKEKNYINIFNNQNPETGALITMELKNFLIEETNYVDIYFLTETIYEQSDDKNPYTYWTTVQATLEETKAHFEKNPLKIKTESEQICLLQNLITGEYGYEDNKTNKKIMPCSIQELPESTHNAIKKLANDKNEQELNKIKEYFLEISEIPEENPITIIETLSLLTKDELYETMLKFYETLNHNKKKELLVEITQLYVAIKMLYSLETNPDREIDEESRIITKLLNQYSILYKEKRYGTKPIEEHQATEIQSESLKKIKDLKQQINILKETDKELYKTEIEELEKQVEKISNEETQTDTSDTSIQHEQKPPQKIEDIDWNILRTKNIGLNEQEYQAFMEKKHNEINNNTQTERMKDRNNETRKAIESVAIPIETIKEQIEIEKTTKETQKQTHNNKLLSFVLKIANNCGLLNTKKE